MANSRRQQQKREKKKAKRRANLARRRPQEKPKKMSSIAHHVSLSARSPIHECLIYEGLFEEGMGNVIVSRSMPNGRIGASMFLVDIWCLGVKGAFFALISPDEYQHKLRSKCSFKTIHPTCARKLVEEAVEYARGLGLRPTEDYQVTQLIFGDIDASACPTHFEFGKDGMPFFVGGPNDSISKCKKIVNTLNRRCGPDGFHFMVPFDVDSKDPELLEGEFVE